MISFEILDAFFLFTYLAPSSKIDYSFIFIFSTTGHGDVPPSSGHPSGQPAPHPLGLRDVRGVRHGPPRPLGPGGPLPQAPIHPPQKVLLNLGHNLPSQMRHHAHYFPQRSR